MDITVYASLPASDLARARAWYETTFGLTPSMENDGGSLFYMLGESGFMIYQSAFAGTNQATAAGIAVDDFDAAIAELRAAGVTFEDVDLGDGMATVDGVLTGPDGTSIAWCKDSEGNILGISQNPG